LRIAEPENCLTGFFFKFLKTGAIIKMGKKSLYKNRGGFQNLPQKPKATILTKK
jgi:hypothetical protein